MTVRAALVLAALALAPAICRAHSLDEYVQASRLSLTKTEVRLDLELTPGVQVAAPILATIDRDGDLSISPGEAADYGRRVLGDLTVTVDGQRVSLQLDRIDADPVASIREGMGTIRVTASGRHGRRVGRSARLSFRNDHAPGSSVYSANALLPQDVSMSVVRQERDWHQRSLEIAYEVRPGLPARTAGGALALAACLVLVGLRRHTRRLEVAE